MPRGCFPFFVKLIQHFLSKAKKRRINFTKRGEDPLTIYTKSAYNEPI
jgi:hypothetical protein